MTPNVSEQRYLDELLSAMRGPCTEDFSGGSFLGKSFAQEFRTTLLIHHYFLKSALSTNLFETEFIRAARAAGHRVIQAPDGFRFWDVEVNGRRFSLKSTAPAKLKMDSLHISKLCEAAWIQDMRGAAQREDATKRLFADYASKVDSIIQFRLFKTQALYEMVEIPVSILKQVADVPRSEFAPDGPSIGIPVGKAPPDFTLKLDRSDAKITLANINKQVCSVLGTWQLAAPH